MKNAELAYRMSLLFDQEITAYYRNSYRGDYGKVQIDVLGYLYEHPSVRASAICDFLGIPKQHVSKILKRFEEEGLVESRPDPEDGRANLVVLTETGRSMVSSHIKESDLHFEAFTASLSREDYHALISSMESIVHILEKNKG